MRFELTDILTTFEQNKTIKLATRNCTAELFILHLELICFQTKFLNLKHIDFQYVSIRFMSILRIPYFEQVDKKVTEAVNYAHN